MKRSLAVLAIVACVLGAGLPAWAIDLRLPSFPVATSRCYLVASTTGCLSWGQARYYSTTLVGGVAYRIVLVVPWGADFDMKVYDENGNLVCSSTNGGSSNEVCYITPRWTGRFTIKVYSFSGSGCFTLQLHRCW